MKMKLIYVINKVFIKYISSSNIVFFKFHFIKNQVKMIFKTIYNFTNETYKNYKMKIMILTKIEAKLS